MALSINDPATEKAARDLAAATGEDLSTAIRKAAEERLQRTRRKADPTLLEDILAIGARCAALPDLDTRSADEILGYDERGLPT